MADHVIAIVDDDERIRELLETFLRIEGYEAVSVSTAAEMLKLAQERQFSAFLIDVEIGRESGIELCRMIRTLDQHKLTPLLCVTGLDEVEIIHKAFDAGADDFITKPVNLAALHARLKVHIQKTDYFTKLERARQMLKRYLSPRVALLAEEFSETGTIPAPTEHHVSICFTDIRGFTALSETMDPVRLFSLLSAHLSDQIDLVYKYGGYVDKFNGDGLMAIFDGEGMVEQCCLCALNIMELTVQQHPTDEKFPIGIGIHTGKAVIGNIGSPSHLDYSAVGPAVNVAARLCGYAQPETIIVSDSVRRLLRESAKLDFADQRHVLMRGVSEPVTIYRLVAKQGT